MFSNQNGSHGCISCSIRQQRRPSAMALLFCALSKFYSRCLTPLCHSSIIFSWSLMMLWNSIFRAKDWHDTPLSCCLMPYSTRCSAFSILCLHLVLITYYNKDSYRDNCDIWHICSSIYTPRNIPGATPSVEQLKYWPMTGPESSRCTRSDLFSDLLQNLSNSMIYSTIYTKDLKNQSYSITRKSYLITIDCQLTGIKAVA